MRTHFSVLMFQTKILQGIPPTSGIRDSKEREEDENMIGDTTEIIVRIKGVGRDRKNFARDSP